VLRKVRIENFKGLGDVEFPLHKLSLIVGENGSGKSSFLQALAILKASANGPQLLTNLPFADLGAPRDLVPPTKMATITVEGEPGAVAFREYLKEYQWRFRFDKDGYSGQEVILRFSDARELVGSWARWGANAQPPRNFQFKSITCNFSFTNSAGRAFQPAGYGSSGQSDAERRAAQEDFALFDSILAAPAEEMSRFEVISAPRAITESSFPLQPNPVPGFNPREGPIQSGAGLAANLLYNPGSSEKISDWESRLVNTRVQSRVTPGHTAQILNPVRHTNYVNEGAGSGQVLFIFERLANCPDGATLGVEEPEIHLHPKAQFELGMLLGEIIASLDRQLILTTHSPSIVSGILSQVRSGKLRGSDVGVSFLTAHQQGSTVSHSRVSDQGTVEGDALKSFVEASIVEASSFLAAKPAK